MSISICIPTYNRSKHLLDCLNSLSLQSDLNFEVLKKFSEHGIEIPFPKRDINLSINQNDLKVLKGNQI